MTEFQQLLEQDLAKIILAILILIILLIIVVVIANISSKRKKAKLDNTRTLHKEEFEKAAKKRMELTQAISRDEIKKELAGGSKKNSKLERTIAPRKASSVDEKTMELNLDSVRRKLIQDEKKKNSNTPKLEDTMEDLKIDRIKRTDSVIVPDIDELKSKALQEEIVEISKPEVIQEEIVEIPKPFSDVNDEFDEILLDDIFEEDDPSELKVIESFNIVDDNELTNANIVNEDGIDFINIDEPEIDIWDDDFGVSHDETGTLLSEDNLGSVVFDDSEIENDTTSMFLSVTSISASENDFEDSIEFVDVEDESVYANNFIFGNEYYADNIDESDNGNVIFDFDLSVNEASLEEDLSNVIFGNYFDEDYTYYEENILYPIFNNSSNEIELEDKVDLSLTRAIVVDEELVIADSVDNKSIVEENIVHEEHEEKPVYDGVVIKKDNDNSSIVVQSIPEKEVVIDITSQLDQLDSYEMDLLDEFDFADENYNYNFNSVNIMEEIVEDMLLDDFVEANDDEYFKYIYQFALLENMIDTTSLEINVDSADLNSTIVDSIETHLKTLTKQLEENIIEEEVEQEEVYEAVEELTGSAFELDSELLDLTSQVMGHNKLEKEVIRDLAYSKTGSNSNFVSPVFGGEKEIIENISILEENSNELEDEYFKMDVEAENEVFDLESVTEDTIDHSVDDFFNMISEKIETEEQEPEEEEFLEILKGLIK